MFAANLNASCWGWRLGGFGLLESKMNEPEGGRISPQQLTQNLQWHLICWIEKLEILLMMIARQLDSVPVLLVGCERIIIGAT